MSIAAAFLASAAAARKARLADHREVAAFHLLGRLIGPQYPVGSATRWCKSVRSRPERRLAEAVAGVVFEASRDDPLSRRVGIVAATAAAAHEAAPLLDLIRSGFDAALAAVEEEIAFVAGCFAVIKATRTRERLAEIAAARAPLLAEARGIEREIVWLRAAIACDEHGPPWAAKAARWGRERDLPRLEARLAELRRQTPAYRLPAAKRCRIEEFTTRLKRLRATARALCRVRRDLGRRPAAARKAA